MVFRHPARGSGRSPRAEAAGSSGSGRRFSFGFSGYSDIRGLPNVVIRRAPINGLAYPLRRLINNRQNINEYCLPHWLDPEPVLRVAAVIPALRALGRRMTRGSTANNRQAKVPRRYTLRGTLLSGSDQRGRRTSSPRSVLACGCTGTLRYRRPGWPDHQLDAGCSYRWPDGPHAPQPGTVCRQVPTVAVG